MLSHTLWVKLDEPAPHSFFKDYLMRASQRVHSAVCALHGHDFVLHFERHRRVCLRCVNCGHETHGWSTN